MYELMVDEWPDVGEQPPVLIIGLTGWMDGGHVSTGSVAYLREHLGGTHFAEIDPMDFYIFHFPVSGIPISVMLEDGRAIVQPVNPMEFTAVFRPHTRIEDGVIEELEYPQNIFSYVETQEGAPDLVVMSGEEPHIRWGGYCDCVFGVCEELGIEDIYFLGSVASPVPHTREPRLRASMADESLKSEMAEAGLLFGEYEGPSSIITSLTYHSMELGIRMRSLVAEVPHYPFLEMPTYPRSILKVLSAVDDLLGLDLDFGELEEAADDADTKLDALLGDNEEFRELVARLEEAYEYEETPADEELLRRLIDTVDLEEGPGEQ